MTISERKISKVRILLEHGGPNNRGWWGMFCPYHGDRKRSAGLNVETGEFVCQACGEHKTIDQLIADRASWDVQVPHGSGGGKDTGAHKRPDQEINETMAEGWHSALLSNKVRLDAICGVRGLSMRTIEKYELGWDGDQEAYTIPIRDAKGNLANVRWYQLDPPAGRRKIWSANGHGTPVLWPLNQLDYMNLVVCEGEMDALLTIQNGIPAITRTGAADVWRPEWSRLFAGKIVYVCHDADTKGHTANVKVSAALRRHANKVVVLELPFKRTADHGKDLTDYWLAGNTRADFVAMAAEANAKTKSPKDEQRVEDEVFGVNVMKSFDAGLVGRPLQMKVTVVGKRTPSYAVPQDIRFECSMNAGKKCESCELRAKEGRLRLTIGPEDPIILRLVNVPEEKMVQAIQRQAGIVKCGLFTHEVRKHRTVEEAYVRASIEEGPSHAEQDFTHRKIISSVSHDLNANETVILTGTIRPHPKNQENEFQAWEVRKPPTGLDSFKPSRELLREMREFRGKDPMAKLHEIAGDQALHYTQIFDRPDLHVFMDLVLHSLLEVPFRNSTDKKGWLDGLVLGDTRTGKSAVARALIDLYRAGEMVNCEAATFAGVVGGLDHMSDGSWIVKWGSVPVFDRRAVVLDEASGLQPQEISQMSDMRSSGLAKLVKIRTEVAHARTRLLWLGNARDGKQLGSNTYALDPLKKLIGNNEDIARFDLAMCVFSDEVGSAVINSFRSNGSAGLFSPEAYRGLLQWAWTRRSRDVKWEAGAQALVLEKAKLLGTQYVEDPPLIQAANVRMKLARISAAIAARLFSSPDNEHVLITKDHVQAAAEFLDHIYSNPGFGYRLNSQQLIRDAKDTKKNMDHIKDYIISKPNLLRILKLSPDVTFMQLKTLVGTDEETRAIMARLWEMKAARMSPQGMIIEAPVMAELRGMGNG